MIKFAIFLILISISTISHSVTFEFTKIPECKTTSFSQEKLKIAMKNHQKKMEQPKNQIKESPIKFESPKPEITYEEYDKDALEKHIENIKQEAEKLGISSSVIISFAWNAEYKPSVKKSSQAQPETKMTFRKYLANQFSSANMEIFKRSVAEKNGKLRMVFDDTESIFDVERSVALALWMHETKFGKIMGNRRIVDALLTLSFNNPRSAFFKKNLLDFLIMVDIDEIDMKAKGSWAGAFGQVQFMPQTFLKYAIDYDQDKKADLFSSEPDIVASLSNYLFNIGWKRNDGIASRVIIPHDFNYCNVGFVEGYEKTIAEWQRLGIRIPRDNELDALSPNLGKKYLADKNKKAWLIVPDRTYIQDGQMPDAFLVYENFGRILDWNRSMFFAITIAILQDEAEKLGA